MKGLPTTAVELNLNIEPQKLDLTQLEAAVAAKGKYLWLQVY